MWALPWFVTWTTFLPSLGHWPCRVACCPRHNSINAPQKSRSLKLELFHGAFLLKNKPTKQVKFGKRFLGHPVYPITLLLSNTTFNISLTNRQSLTKSLVRFWHYGLRVLKHQFVQWGPCHLLLPTGTAYITIIQEIPQTYASNATMQATTVFWY